MVIDTVVGPRVLIGLVAIVAGCGAPPREPAAGSASSADVGVPLDLARAARRFGLTMLADGFTWKAVDPKVTRFAWSGRTASGDREILYSFWLPKLQASEAKLLPQLVASATANVAVGAPCQPHEQPKDFVDLLGVDRVVSACFEPSPFYANEFHHGILHGIVNNGALTIVVVLSDDLAAAIVPMPKSIGARGN